MNNGLMENSNPDITENIMYMDITTAEVSIDTETVTTVDSIEHETPGTFPPDGRPDRIRFPDS